MSRRYKICNISICNISSCSKSESGVKNTKTVFIICSDFNQIAAKIEVLH